MLGESSYKYLTVDEMKSLGDDSMPIDVTHDEKHQKEAIIQHVSFLRSYQSVHFEPRNRHFLRNILVLILFFFYAR